MTTPQNAAPKGPYIAVHDHVFDLGGPDDTPPLYIFGDCEYPNETANDVAALLNRAYAAGVEAAKPKWQPIETAPMDGTYVMLAITRQDPPGYGFVAEGFYEEYNGQWYAANTHWTDAHDGLLRPDAWQPLPSPPEAGG